MNNRQPNFRPNGAILTLFVVPILVTVIGGTIVNFIDHRAQWLAVSGHKNPGQAFDARSQNAKELNGSSEGLSAKRETKISRIPYSTATELTQLLVSYNWEGGVWSVEGETHNFNLERVQHKTLLSFLSDGTFSLNPSMGGGRYWVSEVARNEPQLILNMSSKDFFLANTGNALLDEIHVLPIFERGKGDMPILKLFGTRDNVESLQDLRDLENTVKDGVPLATFFAHSEVSTDLHPD